MIEHVLTSALTVVVALWTTGGSMAFQPPADMPQTEQSTVLSPSPVMLAERTLRLDNRHQADSVNQVFKDNILLNLAYMNGSVQKKEDIEWNVVRQPATFQMVLQPGETFAYHDHVYEKYADSLAHTSGAHFNAAEGFLFSGFLYGDGVCHLASIINWVAQDAGLVTEVPKKHSIAPIPDVPAEYGVSIYTIENQAGSGVGNNLYISNDRSVPISFEFSYDGVDTLRVTVYEIEENTLA